MSQPIRILLNGAKGRMGLAIAQVAASEQAVIAAGVDQGDNLAAHLGAADVVIDFSFHSATLAVAQLCAQHQKPLVIGTTGHTAEASHQRVVATTARQSYRRHWALAHQLQHQAVV
jgi:4-hydroxy-tetrahydrodipicolinate reductase